MTKSSMILLGVAILAGVAAGVVAIMLFANDSSNLSTIPLAEESSLPTPTSRDSAAEVVVDSEGAGDDAPSARRAAGGSQARQTIRTVRQSTGAATGGNTAGQGARAIRRATGPGPGGGGAEGGPGAGGPEDFEAIQRAIEENPELRDLMAKAQTGDISQEEMTRIQELMSEIFEESGFGDLLGGGPPPNGSIVAVDGSEITLQPPDEFESEIYLTVGEETEIQIISLLSVDDLAVGDSINAVAQRGEDGVNRAISITFVDQDQADGFGFGGGGGQGAGLFGGPAGISSLDGEVVSIEDDEVSIETDRGTLRVVVDDETLISSTRIGTVADLSEDMVAIAFGDASSSDEVDGDGDEVSSSDSITPRTIIAGPPELLELDGGGGDGGLGFGGP